MKQYHVYRTKRKRRSTKIHYLFVLQNEGIYNLSTVISAPVISVKNGKPLDVINPVIALNSEEYFVEVESLSAVRLQEFGDCVGDFSDKHYEITKAIDRLFSGI